MKLRLLRGFKGENLGMGIKKPQTNGANVFIYKQLLIKYPVLHISHDFR
jgi:hypothetical protein